MKTEEIKPGDILYDEERKILVKVARVDEDGLVKYSAYTNMKGIFMTAKPPYRIGPRTADAFIPATDEQRKYMEKELAACEKVNLPEIKRMEALAYIIADLKTENIELEQRIHQLMDDSNNVEHQLQGMEKRKDEDPSRQTLCEMLKMRDHCDKLEKENKELKGFANVIHSFMKDKKIYLEKGTSCGYIQGSPAVCSTACLECDSCLGVIEECGVICRQVLYDVKVSSVKR